MTASQTGTSKAQHYPTGPYPGEGPPPRLPDSEMLYPMPADSETVVVSFGAKGGGHGVFHFFKLLKPLPGFSKLLVRDPNPHWYNDGIPGVGETVEEIAASIRLEAERLGGRRIVTLGPSMGAYAAILFGCLMEAERAIALAPQTVLDSRLRHSPPATLELQAPDLAPFIERAPATAVDIVAGWDDPLDVFHAQRVADLPSVRVLALRGGVHGFVEDVHREGKLVPLITELVGGGTPAMCDVDPELDPDDERRMTETAFGGDAGDWEAVVGSIGPVAARHPEWAGPSFALGRALSELKRLPEAEEPLRRAVSANPAWQAPRTYLISCLLGQGQPAEAEELAKAGLDLDPEWEYGREALTRCAAARGRA